MPLVLDEGDLPTADTASPLGTPVSTFFVQNSSAAKLLGKVLDQVYHPSLNSHPSNEPRSTPLLRPDVLSSILSLHSEIEDLMSCSMHALSGSEESGTGVSLVLRRQRNVLHARSVFLESSDMPKADEHIDCYT